ncbi:hypothetical protein Bca52824_003493 [Brassica carinata]|uniref:Uncharacterized protein n=1 Tax=Brassica carinata TaxID=52824 RepID=A0A8X7WK21_BRACI|nr:hypothetical protein Bca52824_003493 [Brassica carinata]
MDGVIGTVLMWELEITTQMLRLLLVHSKTGWSLSKEVLRIQTSNTGQSPPITSKNKTRHVQDVLLDWDDFDSYDLMLINKWSVSGFDGSAEAYVNMRRPGSLVFKVF